MVGRAAAVRGRVAGVLLAVSCLAFNPGAAQACAFDMIKPEQTAIDRIVGADTLVLARATDANRFTFDVTRVLYGDATPPPINQLVDSATRRKLSANAGHTVLFAHTTETGWRRVAYVDDSFHPVLMTALDHRAAWRDGMPQSRLDFIVALQNSPDPVHKTVVIGELDKVPYAELRALDLRIPDTELLADLWSLTGYPYQATRALLLGISGTPVARAEIHDYLTRVADWDLANNLGAFAAAYIELEGAAGVEYLSDTMLLDPAQPPEKLEQLVMAMSVHHGIAGPDLRAAIQDNIDTLVSRRPETGVIVARQFALRSDWSQTALLEPLVRDRAVALADLLTISVYVARARETGTNTDGTLYE